MRKILIILFSLISVSIYSQTAKIPAYTEVVSMTSGQEATYALTLSSIASGQTNSIYIWNSTLGKVRYWNSSSFVSVPNIDNFLATPSIVNTNQLINGSGFITSETDPLFAVWNKSSGISITKSQISDFPTIPTNTNELTNGSGFITSYTEIDPLFTAWNKTTGISIAESQVTNLTSDLSAKAPLASPSFTTPSLGVATATSINGTIITSGTGTLTLAAGKILTCNNSITLAGTDATTITLPSTTGTVALNNQTCYIGTTAVAINRTSASLTLAGITLTTPNIGAATGTSAVLTGAITSSGTAGIGYATGAGGTVSQATSQSTGVTLSKLCGTITMTSAALAANTSVSFTVTNTLVTATDMVIVEHTSGGTIGAYNIVANTMAAGSFVITVRNLTSGSLTEAPVIRFIVIKATAS